MLKRYIVYFDDGTSHVYKGNTRWEAWFKANHEHPDKEITKVEVC